MWGALGDAASTFIATILDSIMKGIWIAALDILQAVFTLVDALTTFTVTFDGGKPVDPSIAASWGVLQTLSVTIALGLFFWQLITTMLHGGKGFFRAATGPFAYGIALTATGGFVAALLLGADELTRELLARGFDGAIGFSGLLDNDKFGHLFSVGGAGQAALNGVSAVALGLLAIFGVIPAALGYMGEMVFRQAAILVLVSTIPLTAAGLVAQTTSTWFWKTLRWILAAIVMKPALALVMVVGVSMLANPQGLGGLLAGIGVLLIALFCPYTLFRLFSFVEPGTNAGAASRAWASSMLSSLSPSGGGGQVDTSNPMSSAEDSNTARFDQAGGGSSGGSSGGSGSGGGSSMPGPLGQLIDRATAAGGQANNFAAAQMDATGVGSQGGGPPMSTNGGGGQGGDTGDHGGSPGSQSPSGPGDTDAAAPPPTEAPLAGAGGSGRSGGPGGGGGDDPPPPEQPPGRDSGPDGGVPHGPSGGGGGPHPPGGGGGGKSGGGGGKSGGASAGEIEEAAVVL
jgi:hypothetical protein